MFNKQKKSTICIVASAGDLSQPEKLPKSHEGIEIIEPSSKIRKYKCNHEGPKTYKIDVYGQVTKEIKKRDVCAQCRLEIYKKHVIRCVSCGLPIHPGDGVALYSPNKNLTHFSSATFVGESVMGCIRWDCCPSGGFFAGHWSENGFKSAFDNTNTSTK